MTALIWQYCCYSYGWPIRRRLLWELTVQKWSCLFCFLWAQTRNMFATRFRCWRTTAGPNVYPSSSECSQYQAEFLSLSVWRTVWAPLCPHGRGVCLKTDFQSALIHLISNTTPTFLSHHSVSCLNSACILRNLKQQQLQQYLNLYFQLHFCSPSWAHSLIYSIIYLMIAMSITWTAMLNFHMSSLW